MTNHSFILNRNETILSNFKLTFALCLLFQSLAFNDTSAQEKPYDRLNYEALNKVVLPNASLSKNKIQNPSFEQGTHLWTTVEASNTAIVDLEHDKDWFKIDNSQAWHGENSARLTIWDNTDYNHLHKYDEWSQDLRKALKDKGEQMNYCHPFIITNYIQVEKDKSHTVSFYAKGEIAGTKIMAFAASDYNTYASSIEITLTEEWKKYEFSFTAPKEYVAIMFGENRNAPRQKQLPQKTYYWVDGFQLEKGNEATAFHTKPLVASLGNTPNLVDISASKDISLKVTNRGNETLSPKFEITVKDFLKNIVLQKTVADTKVKRKKDIDLSFNLNNHIAHIGSYTIEVEITDGTYHDLEIFRYAVMDESSVKNLKRKKVFGYGGTNAANHVKTVERYKQLGLGLMMNNSHDNMDENYIQLWKTIDAPVLYPVFKRFDGYLDLRHKKNISDAELDLLAVDLKKYFKKYPNIKYWKVVNEPEYFWKNSFMYDTPQLAKYMKMMYNTLKSVNPEAKVVSPDLANVSQGSMDWMEALFKEGAGDYFDILAIHTYQKTPELPSLDKSLSYLTDMADRYNFPGEIWLTEGGHYLEQNLPALNFDATIFDGHFESKMPPFTEDITGYPVGIALSARTTLTVLKHADRVTANTEWALNNLGFETLSMRPHNHAIMYHSLAKQFGNSTFKDEYKFGNSVKCYLFEDGNGGGIAAIWDFDPALAKEQRDQFVFHLDNEKGEVTYTNIFGKGLSSGQAKSHYEMNIGYMPKFIKSQNLSSLKTSLDNSYILFNKKDALISELFLKDPYTVELVLFNQYHEKATGTIKANINGQILEKSYNLNKQSQDSISIPLMDLVDYSASAINLDLLVEVYDENKSLLKTIEDNKNITLIKSTKEPISIDGDLSDWKDISFHEIKKKGIFHFDESQYKGEKDLSGKIGMTWNEKAFYFCVIVQDDQHTQQYVADETWRNDGVQLFFDTYNNGLPEETNLEDDYAWSFSRTPEGDQSFKSYVPAWQSSFQHAGMANNVDFKTSRNEEKKETIYEMRISKSSIMPLSLNENSIFGMATMINDADEGERTTGLMSSYGYEPWQNPGYYPDIILVK